MSAGVAVAVALDGLRVRYGAADSLHGIDWRGTGGALVAVAGPNGAGKTSLLKALAGLIPSQGRILLNGGSPTPAERARLIAYLPQGHHAFWPLPVREIVALGRYPHGVRDPRRMGDADRAAVARAMDLIGISALAGRPVTELSGGERARVALARVLAVDAPILLADEPVAALDPACRLAIMGVLRRLAEDEGKLVLAVGHDLTLAARFAHRVLVLDAGRIAADGPPDAALDADTLARVFGVTALTVTDGARRIPVPWHCR